MCVGFIHNRQVYVLKDSQIISTWEAAAKKQG